MLGSKKLVSTVTSLVTLLLVSHAISDEESAETDESHDSLDSNELFNRSRHDHAEHENHIFVSLMSSDLLEAMLKRKGLKGFELMIANACGPGRRSMGHFSNLFACLRRSKESMLDTVEEIYNAKQAVTIRDHIAVTTFCGVLPKIVDCKEDLCDAIRDCDNYTGNLELVNKMHRLLIKHYCKNQSVDLLNALSVTSRKCAKHLLKTVQDCWGKAGLDYNDITSVLRRLSKKQMLCQQLVGTQKCLAEQYNAREDCLGPMGSMIQDIAVQIEQEYSCYEYGHEGRDLLGF